MLLAKQAGEGVRPGSVEGSDPGDALDSGRKIFPGRADGADALSSNITEEDEEPSPLQKSTFAVN